MDIEEAPKKTWVKQPVIKLQSVRYTGAILSIAQKPQVITANKLSRSGRETLIQAKNPEDYRKMVKIIEKFNEENPIQWIAFSLEEDIKPRMVLRGLSPTTNTTEMFEAIRDEYEIEVVSIKNMTSRKSDKRHLPMFVMTVERENTEKLKSITNLMHMKIKIEATGPTQCFNCQGYHHAQRACFKAPRCVKCGEEHSSKSCQMPKDQKAKCANCQGQHPANFR
ncbi:uncharacterized protein [Diabrotica undecimpunctata]|uniref:uncharacterized protein n=1 Tax=Diabrotica undecimpunctata TaxID=50387 RepID=UPI003B63B918